MHTGELSTVLVELRDVATRAYNLAMGLQGAAPAQAGGPSPSTQYLLEISIYLNRASQELDGLPQNQNTCENLVRLIGIVVQHDASLREKYQAGDRFRFVRDRLHALFVKLEEQLPAVQDTQIGEMQNAAENECEIYVYLYNAQGAILRSWVTMLTPRVFYEHSINRPIYSDKKNVETLLRSKSNPAQHGYLTVRVRKEDILPADAASPSALLKVREGALKVEKFVMFTHNGVDYVLNAQGELVKK